MTSCPTCRKLRLWDGTPLPTGLAARLRREYAGWQFVHQQILALETERRTAIRESQEPVMAQVLGNPAPQGHRRKRRLALCDGVLRLARLP